jgi:uncharacterized membrane protein
MKMDSKQTSMDDRAGKPGGYGESERSGLEPDSKNNVGNMERWISAAAGGALIVYGIRKRSWLGTLIALGGGNLLMRGTLGRSLLYRALGVNTALRAAGRENGQSSRIQVDKGVTIERSPEEAYRFWRNFENLPRIMEHLRSVRNIDGRRSHWVAKAPAGLNVEWDAEIIEETENRKISWRSLEGSDVYSQGTVYFEPAQDGRGTQVRVILEYQPPGGKAGAALAKLFGEEPSQQIEEDLQRLKRVMETGEVSAQGQMAR